MKLKVLLIDRSDILYIFKIHEILLEANQFVVIFASVVGDDWDSILKLH